MRWVFVALLAGVLAFSGSPAEAKEKVPCKKIKELVKAGKTPDEAAKELGVRVQRVEHCMSGKKKAEGAAGATGSTADADEDSED